MSNAVIEHGLDKKAILTQAAILLADGIPTDQIVAQLGLPITGRTLRNWITADDDAPKARTAFFANKLIACAEAIDDAQGDFPLARARESYRSWSHLAGVRDARNFGPKQEVTHNLPQGPLIQVNLAVSGATLGATTIDGDAKLVDNQ